MKKRMIFFAVFLFGMISLSAFAHSKHVHGEAEMNVVLDGGELTIEMRSPLANFIGFEHTPKNKQQEKAFENMMAFFQDADRVFFITPEAACTVATVRLNSTILDNGAQKASSRDRKTGKSTGKRGDHHDLEAFYSFICNNPDKLKGITAQIFSHFRGLKTIEVQAIGGGRQMAARLTARTPVLSW